MTTLTETPAPLSDGSAGSGAVANARENAEATPRAPHVVGVDLSLTATGIATPTGVHTITSRGAKTATLTQRDTRLRNLRDQILTHCKNADLVVIENPAYSRQMGAMHDRSGLWWLIVRILHSRDIPVAAVTPTSRAKYATGKGNAGKDEVLAAVIRRFPTINVTNNNEADALTLRAMALDHYGAPLASMPATNRQSLGAVDWPELVTANA